MAIAKQMQKYFWDINPRKAHPKSHPEYYVKRILELGDKKAFLWLKRVFGIQKISKFAKKSTMSPKSKNFWNMVFTKQ